MIAASGLWWPWAKRLRLHRPKKEFTLETLLPYIQRCRGYFAKAELQDWPELLKGKGFRHDFLWLTSMLTALSIPYPSNAASGRIWIAYLWRLESLCTHPIESIEKTKRVMWQLDEENPQDIDNENS